MIQQYFAACGNPNFLQFPTWYAYLPTSVGTNGCVTKVTSLSDVWLVVAALIEIMLRVGAIVAVVFIIYGGGQYIMSQGNPDAANRARSTVVNALIGLLLTVSAAAIVQF